MSKHSKYFHRAFMSRPDDEGNGDSIIARVSSTGSDYLSASLILSDGYDSVHLSSFEMDEEGVDRAVERTKVLVEVVQNFYKALEEEAKTVKKAIAAKPKGE